MALIDWATHVYIDNRQKLQWRELEQNYEKVSQSELFFETQEHEPESLVIGDHYVR